MSDNINAIIDDLSLIARRIDSINDHPLYTSAHAAVLHARLELERHRIRYRPSDMKIDISL